MRPLVGDMVVYNAQDGHYPAVILKKPSKYTRDLCVFYGSTMGHVKDAREGRELGNWMERV